MILKKISLILLSLWCVSIYSENIETSEKAKVSYIELPKGFERFAYKCFEGDAMACERVSSTLEHYFGLCKFHGTEPRDPMINMLKSRFCKGSKSCKRRCIEECQKKKHNLCAILNKYSSDNK